MKIDIIIVYMSRYEKGHEMDFVPPVTGIHLAALTPKQHEVRVIHQQVEPVKLESDADLIALSFFTGFAPEAYRLADGFKQRGKLVIGGGPHVTYWPDEALQHCDAVVIGEVESVWAQVVAEAEAGQLRQKYYGTTQPLEGLPTPRYDLLPNAFFIKRVVQATRGCPFSCSFCTVPTINPGFRVRPVEEVIRDIQYDEFPYWWQRKVVWFWDDNLTAKRAYIKELLRAMIPLNRWWLTQASMDIARDEELLDLMAASGCIGVFFGIESFGQESLRAANKRQNKAAAYKQAIEALHKRGICVMAGFVAGFDGDTPESIIAMAHQLYEIGVDVPFLSVLTPYKGTPLYDQFAREGRLLEAPGLEFYNGYNVTFRPKYMTPAELLQAHRQLWRTAFSPGYVQKRIIRASRYLRPGAFMMTMFMNGFYGLKRLRGNEPVDFKKKPYRAVSRSEYDPSFAG
jgi:radical SAM superfamily enzyme YgiQ (UPF0313 family)